MAKKRKTAVTALAVILAVALLFGGTIAYLTDSSTEVTNTFDTNKVDVDLEEPSGTEYEIVPGTSETKDPYVTVTATLDAYVYVLVYGNNPEYNGVSAITYEYADGWEELTIDFSTLTDDQKTAFLNAFGLDSSSFDTDTVITILYQEVSEVEDEVLEILKNNLVYYDAEITNEAMEYYESTGDIYLSFVAYVIQKAPFNDPLTALLLDLADVKNANELTAALSSGQAIALASNITMDAETFNTNAGESTYINLNGFTLTLTSDATTSAEALSDIISLTDGESLTIENGTVEYSNENLNAGYSAICLYDGSELALNDVTFNTSHCILVAQGAEDVTVNIVDSEINSTGYYAVSTNAGTASSGSNVVINIENSVLNVESAVGDGDATAVLFNILGTLNITDSTITATRQAVFVRCGTANITNSELITTGEYVDNYSDTNAERLAGTWKSGNEAPAAALVVGNLTSGSYLADAIVTLSNVTLTVESNTDVIPQLYVASNGDYKTAVTGVSSGTTFRSYNNGSSTDITINGNNRSSAYNNHATMSTISD